MTEAKMQETPAYAPGTFCWVELATSDSAAAKKFYTELFGWSFTDNPMGPDMVYTMLQLDGKEVGALFGMDKEMESMGVPPNWLSYVSVTNADETSAKATDAGATLLKGPFDVATYGRMAVIQDPTGAVFALWQPATHIGSGITNVPNSFRPDGIHHVRERRAARGRHVQDHAGDGTHSPTLAGVFCRRRLRCNGRKSGIARR
jgi:predicted enzyme related to lactoylglutathione lyase